VEYITNKNKKAANHGYHQLQAARRDGKIGTKETEDNNKEQANFVEAARVKSSHRLTTIPTGLQRQYRPDTTIILR